MQALLLVGIGEAAMKDIQKKIHTVVPWYSIVPLVLAFSFNMAVYGGARIIAGEWHHYNIEGTLDRMIPFLPVSAVVYITYSLFYYLFIISNDKYKTGYSAGWILESGYAFCV